jgi:putative membrane protein
MFLTIKNFNGNLELTILVNLLIYILILLSIPLIFMGIISLFKVKVTSKKSIYLYAFSTGMFLMIGAAGFIKEGYVLLEQ